MIIEIDKYIKFIEQNKNEKYYAKLHILKILSKNKKYIFSKIKSIYTKYKKKLLMNENLFKN